MMKTNIKKSVLIPLLVITGFTYAPMNVNNIHKKEINIKKNDISSAQQQTPDLKFKDENGKTISLKSLKGKVVFINLWATWCQPCIYEIPTINELRKKFKDHEDLVFLMVDMDGKIEKSKDWMKDKKYDLPVYVPDGEIPRELFDGSIPTTFLVDKQNEIVGRQVGGADYSSQEAVDLITKLLNEK